MTQSVYADAFYGHLTAAPSAGGTILVVSQDSTAPAFSTLLPGQQIPLCIVPDTGGLPDLAHTERRLATLAYVSGSGVGALWTFTVDALSFAHSISDQVFQLFTAEGADKPPSTPLGGPAMARWFNRLGNTVTGGNVPPANGPGSAGTQGPAILVMFTDSFGSDFDDAWLPFKSYMGKKYNGTYAPTTDLEAQIGLVNITSALGGVNWPTVQGTTLGTRGITGRAQRLTAINQVCTSWPKLTDGVMFRWLADASGAAGALALQVDGVTVATVDSSAAGSHYTALTTGQHTIGYKNVGSGAQKCTVDSPYFYLNNYASGVQIWDISHSGAQTATFNALADLPAAIADLSLGGYASPVQAHAVMLGVGSNNDAAASSNITEAGITLSTLTNVITVPANSIPNGGPVYGTGIAVGTYVVSGGGTTSITLSQNPTANGTVTLTFCAAVDYTPAQHRTQMQTLWNTIVTAFGANPLPSLVVTTHFQLQSRWPNGAYEVQDDQFALANGGARIDLFPALGVIGGNPSVGGADPLQVTWDGYHPSSLTKEGVFLPAAVAMFDIAGYAWPGNPVSSAAASYSVVGYETDIVLTAAAPIAVSVPQPQDLNVAPGTRIPIIVAGSQTATVTAATGTLVTPPGGANTVVGPFGIKTLSALTATEWLLS